MQLELAQKIVDIACEYDFDSDDIEIRSYRGRCSSKETTAIVGLSLTQILRIVIENANEFVEDNDYPIFQSVGNLQSDSMGLSTIIY